MTRHSQWLLDNGCTGIISLGSLGQGATLTFAEKEAVLRNMTAAVGDRAPVVASISALSTEEAVALAKAAEQAGCSGLMVLPPYVYCGDWREMKAHVTAVFRATPLSCMLYNNPVAYGTDFLPEQIAELAQEYENFAAVKESSTDVRRVTAIRALTGDRLQVFVGVDDAIVEGHCRWSRGLGGRPGERLSCRVGGAVQLGHIGKAGGSLCALSLVPAASANGYGAEVRSAHPPGATGDRDRQCARASAAVATSRHGVGRDARYRQRGGAQSACGAEHGILPVIRVSAMEP